MIGMSGWLSSTKSPGDFRDPELSLLAKINEIAKKPPVPRVTEST
jgi:hypothetical protein